MRTREWEVVVEALKRLGCNVYGTSDTHVNIVRFPKVFPLRKMPVSILVQRKMIATLGFTEHEWIQALRELP